MKAFFIKFKNLHLLLSGIIVCAVSFVYGGYPQKILPLVFGFHVEDLEHKNIFRAIMGLYWAFSLFWFYGLKKPKYWEMATVSNILFMGGLAIGRLISLIFDGFSPQYFPGMLLEFLMMGWGVYNLKLSDKKK